MFGKKECSKCREKIERKYRFCPYCGNPMVKKEDYGMLGTDDSLNLGNPRIMDNLFESMGSGIFNKMIGNAVKMIEKELEKEMKNQKNQERQPMDFPQKTNFEIIINGKRINPANIGFSQRMIPIPNSENKASKKSFKKTSRMSSESLKKMAKLPKKEPETNIRRLSNKVIYEINIPGVKSMDDVSITKLESSIEVKALAKDKAYSKLIPINLPIINFELSDGKLTLELDAKS